MSHLVLHEQQVLLFPLEIQSHVLRHLLQESFQPGLQLFQALLYEFIHKSLPAYLVPAGSELQAAVLQQL